MSVDGDSIPADSFDRENMLGIQGTATPYISANPFLPGIRTNHASLSYDQAGTCGVSTPNFPQKMLQGLVTFW